MVVCTWRNFLVEYIFFRYLLFNKYSVSYVFGVFLSIYKRQKVHKLCNKLTNTTNGLVKTLFSHWNFIVIFCLNYTTDFPFGFGLFLFNRISTKRFVPPTDLIGLKKLILHIFSNLLAFYPFYFCIFWENISPIYKKKVCLLRRSGICITWCFWNRTCYIHKRILFYLASSKYIAMEYGTLVSNESLLFRN